MIVGLDIGTKLIKVVALGGSRRRPRLLRFVVREVPEGGPEALPAVLLALFREERLPHDRVFTSLRTQDVVIREITVPFVQEDAIRRTIKFEAETAFHGASIENMVIDYSLISTGAEKSRVLVVGAQKKTVAGVLSLLNSAGIDPVGIGLDLGALYNTAAWCGVLPANEAAILIDVGTSSARLVVVEDGRIRAARAIRLQAAPVPLPALPEGPAKDEPSEEKEVAEPAHDDRAAKAVARVSSEVARTLIGCRLRRPLAGVWATGGGPARAAISQGVAERLSIESHDLPLADLLGAETDGPAELGVAAIGAALVRRAQGWHQTGGEVDQTANASRGGGLHKTSVLHRAAYVYAAPRTGNKITLTCEQNVAKGRRETLKKHNLSTHGPDRQRQPRGGGQVPAPTAGG